MEEKRAAFQPSESVGLQLMGDRVSIISAENLPLNNGHGPPHGFVFRFLDSRSRF
tara:strand:- start:1122 stop:1286 length:165 start_codon:yes stop_codon:yes gene_type:complete